MRVIGIDGGHSVYEVGTVSDVVLFFDCIDYFAIRSHGERDWRLLSDRLYKRYLRFEELSLAGVMMKEVSEIFSNVPSSAVEWKSGLIGASGKTWLDPNRANLAEVFVKFFDGFEKACQSSVSFFNAFEIYQPVRITPSDLAGFASEKARSFAEYDELEGEPFWLR